MPPPPKTASSTTELTNTQCYVCDGSYRNFILPVVYTGAMEFLESRRFNDKMPIELTYNNCELFVDKLAKDKDWLFKVFGKETMARYQVAAFYFQLFPTKIISCEKIGTNGVSVGVAEDARKGKLFKNILIWEGIEFRANGRGGRVIPFKECVKKIADARTAMSEL